MNGRSNAAVAACPSYSPDNVKAALAEAVETLGGMSGFIKPGATVLVKPNLFSAHPPEHAVTTHPEIVRHVVMLCIEAGAGRVWVGDSPVGAQDEARLWSITGMTDAIKDTSAELKSWHARQIPLNCGDEALAVPEWYNEVDAVISLPKLKTHCLTTLTCALKNVFGIVSGQAKIKFHVKYPSPETMSGFLVRVFAALKPCLSIVDAVVAMEGNGPAHGNPLKLGAIMAGVDAVALDSIACGALKIAPASAPMIRLAAEAGLGHMDKAMIDCVGSGVDRLNAVRLKPSISRFLMRLPEALYGLSPKLWELRPKIVDSQCAKCGNCMDDCPGNAIEAQGAAGFPRIDRKKCIDCYCCMESCPQGAIAMRLYFASLVCVATQNRRAIKNR